MKSKKKKVKSRAAAEKERKNTRKERQRERRRERDARLQRRAKRREEEKKSRAERGEPDRKKVKRSVRRSSHGTEEVDATILKVLGRSHKSKKVGSKVKDRMVEKEVVARQTWRHGLREERHEDRTGKAQQEKSWRKKLKASKVSPSKDNLGRPKALEERQPKADVGQVPIVDMGPDNQADGGHSEGNGDGAESLAASSKSEEAAELASPQPAQNLLDPEAFCQKFFQVRSKQFCIILNMVEACFLFILLKIH